MPRPRLRRILAAALLATAVGFLTAPTAAADDPAFTIRSDEVDTATGLAADAATNTYWVVNRTGDQGAVYALTRTGRDKGTLGFRAEPTDVEAVAYRGGRLYVGDIGDAKGNRDFVTVYLFDNVTPDAGVVTYHAWDFSYPDGAKDAKAMVVDDSGRLYLITTGKGAGIYAAPAEPSRQGVNELERVGDAPGTAVTDAVALGSGRWALRTEDQVEVYDPSTKKLTASGDLPVSDGQALGTDLAGDAQLLAAESGSSAQVFSLSVPTKIQQTSPSPSPTPTSASPSPSGSSSPGAGQAPDDEESSTAGRRTGTWVALGSAAILAALAGVAVALLPIRRKRLAARTPAAVSAAQSPAQSPADTAPAFPPESTPFVPPVPAALNPADLAGDAGSPATPAREPVAQPARAAEHTGGYGAGAEPRRAREPGDIEDDDDEPDWDPEDLDTTVLRSPVQGSPVQGSPVQGSHVVSDERADAVAPDDDDPWKPPVAPPPQPGIGYDRDLWGQPPRN